MPANAPIAGVILAGGLSRRMGGGDKGLLELGAGRAMIDHVVARLKPQVSALAINANGDAQRFARFGLPIIADPVADYPGPLAGVLAGLEWASRAEVGAHYIATVSADAPFVPGDLVARLQDGLQGRETSIAIARSGGHLHPVIGLWPVAHAGDLAAALASGMRKVLAWTDRHGTIPVDFPMIAVGARQVDPFFNANTPDELDEARAVLREMDPP